MLGVPFLTLLWQSRNRNYVAVSDSDQSEICVDIETLLNQAHLSYGDVVVNLCRGLVEPENRREVP